ncbi:MAG: PIN domain-containing protein [Nanoarchaeota archaeon]
MTMFFYDSYAIIEYVNDNPHFADYFEVHSGILSLLNLLEVYYIVLKEAGLEKADIIMEQLFPFIVQPTKNEIRQAMTFRNNRKKQDLSYADCLGYVISLSRALLFLTGDKQFIGMDNVQFVK